MMQLILKNSKQETTQSDRKETNIISKRLASQLTSYLAREEGGEKGGKREGSRIIFRRRVLHAEEFHGYLSLNSQLWL